MAKLSDAQINMMWDMKNNVCLVFTDEVLKMARGEILIGKGLCYQKTIDNGDLGGKPLCEFFLTSDGEAVLQRLEAEALKKTLDIVSPTDDLMAFAAAYKADHAPVESVVQAAPDFTYTAYDIQLLKRLCEDKVTETGIVINTWDALDNRSGARLVALGYATVKEEWRNMWGEVYGGVVLATEKGRELLKSLNKEAHETLRSTADAVELVLMREEKSKAIDRQRDIEGAFNEGYERGQEDTQALLKTLRKIDLDSLSPLEALTKLSELKRMAGKA